MVVKLKQLTLLIIALMTSWLCVPHDVRSTWTQSGFNALFEYSPALAQGDTSPLDQPDATGTIFPTVTPTLTGTPTIVPTATLTPTATATPGNIAQIEFPSHGSVMFGFTTIRGTALINQYRKYDIHVSASGAEDWQWLTTSYAVVRGGDLYTLDTTKFPDGFYDIRVRAIQDGGNFNEAFCRRVEIRNENPPTQTPVSFNEEGTPFFSPLSPLTTPTPAPTQDVRIRIPGAQGFYGPAQGSTIGGYTPIKATVNNLGFNFFDRYELFISRAGMEEWSQLVSSTEQHWQDTIYVLNTEMFANGHYDLRLRIVYQDSNYSQYHLRRLRIANSGANGNTAFSSITTARNGIHSPSGGQRVHGTVDFTGTAVHPDFLRWELYWSPSGDEAWSFLVEDDSPVANELFARLDLSQLPDGAYDFRLRVVKADYNYDEYFSRRVHLDNSLISDSSILIQ